MHDMLIMHIFAANNAKEHPIRLILNKTPALVFTHYPFNINQQTEISYLTFLYHENRKSKIL
jgi:hypothetical protein